MSVQHIIEKLKRCHRCLNGSTITYNCDSYRSIVDEIKSTSASFTNMSDVQLQNLSQKLRHRVKSHENIDALLVEAFALVKESISRVLKIEPFDEQITGGIVLHQGKIAEMQTGEGKTLTAVFPAYLNALWGKGVHVVTFNDYLAKRDAEWMGPVYNFLGMSVGYIQERMNIQDRQNSYNADITYVTAKEAGFDFLRNSLCYDAANIVQREFNFAIIDEADSILIDEARIPLIIAGITESQDIDSKATTVAKDSITRLVRDLYKQVDFEFDAYARNIFLTEKGLKHAEELLRCKNIYAPENSHLLSQLHFALHAEYLLHRDQDYIVRNGNVELIDDFTGRVADNRRWPDGLQAAVEAKEQCNVKQKGIILNSIALQHFLTRYPKLCGMTATAQIAEQEFREFYNLHIVVIPSHKQCVRIDLPDIIYNTKAEKQIAIINEIVRIHKTGQPVLVGTQSVVESADLAEILDKQGLRCEVLNAKRDEFEAGIISLAGKIGAITIATNMAGRGTDIRLGGAHEEEKERVISLGGLYVIGTNRFESRRIDNQLKGRAGRQGDPGTTQFIISLDDNLCIQYKLRELIPVWALLGNKIDNPIVRIELDRLQRIIENQHLEVKKTLCKYSFLIEQQRKILFQKRSDILMGKQVLGVYKLRSPEQFSILLAHSGEEAVLRLCQDLSLANLDKAWSAHCAEINEIRETIHLRSYGKQDPHFEYNKCAIELFDALLKNIDNDALAAFEAITISNGQITLPHDTVKAPSATWTYLVNDNPFEDAFAMELIGNTGFSLWAGLLWPLTGLYFMAKKFKKKKAANPDK